MSDGGTDVITPVTAATVDDPIPVVGSDGKIHLAYELLLTNVMSDTVSIRQLQISASEQPLLTLDAPALGGLMRRGSGLPGLDLSGGESARLTLDVVIPPTTATPSSLRNTLTVVASKPSPPLIPRVIPEPIMVTVSQQRAITIAAPLRGDGWLNGDGCCRPSAHRSAANPINGKVWLAERFAIDWVRLDAAGKMFTGNRAALTSYPFYGADIHSVADSTVVGVVDNLPDQVPGVAPTGLPLDQYGGNNVVAKISDHVYVFYAHLKPGSVRVRVGDRLTEGQVIGLLGNSGNSDAPHLHFHVMNAPDPLRAAGIPYQFERFTLARRVQSPAEIDSLLASGGPVQTVVVDRTVSNAYPLDLDVVNFPTD